MENAQRMAQLQLLHNMLVGERTRRDADTIDAPPTLGVDATPGDATRPGDGEHPSRGMTRPHSEIDDDNDNNEFSDRVTIDNSGPYTVEEGRALKRHKNLTPQANADADVFLKVCFFIHNTGTMAANK